MVYCSDAQDIAGEAAGFGEPHRRRGRARRSRRAPARVGVTFGIGRSGPSGAL